MFGLGAAEIIVILVLALIFIGPKKLPELAKGLGKGIRDFQNALKGVTENPPADEQPKVAEHDVQDKENKKNS